MSNEMAQLLITNSYNPLGLIERRDFEWRGKSRSVEVTNNVLWDLDISRFEKEIQIGPYRLVLLGRKDYSDTCLYIRKDYPLWWLLVFWHKAIPVLDLIYRRFIITLAVWNLADYNRAVVPNWRDIRLFKRLRLN